LYLTTAENYGGKTKKKPSRFIYEIGMKTLKHESIKTLKQEGRKPERENKLQAINIKDNNLAKEKKLVTLPKTFSYSQLKAFETCPYQYYLSFILKVPTPGNAVFSYGKTMHITLQKFLAGAQERDNMGQRDLFGTDTQQKKNILPSLAELLKFYKESWIDDWYENKGQKEGYREKGERSLKRFYAEMMVAPPQVMQLEKGFNLKVGSYTVRGVIDRVDRLSDDKVVIIDYKTGEAKSEGSVDKDQLLIYQLAARDVLGWEVEKLIYYYLDNNSAVSFLGAEKELDKIKEKIIRLIEGIKNYDFTATPGQHTCKYCDFGEICQFREL
jgi:RecB family exonuclease